MRHTSAFAIAAVVVASCAASAAAAEVKQSAKGLTYSLRVPSGWDNAKGGLLVVALHGMGGSNTQFMPAVEHLPYLADAVLIAPNAPAGASWTEADIPVVASLIAEVRDRYHTGRTIAYGFSRGAYFSFGLGLLHPDLVQACIPHSGGLVVPIPDGDAVKAQVFYVIHGDADGTVPVDQSRDAVNRLEAAGLKGVKYEEVKGLGHTVDFAATRRAFDWVAEKLGPIGAARVTEAQAKERLAALDKAIAAKDADAVGEALEALAHASHAASAKAVRSADKGLKGKDDKVALACADGLAKIGGDAATAALIAALGPAESAKRDEVAAGIQAALTKITGKTFASAKEWKRWAAGKA